MESGNIKNFIYHVIMSYMFWCKAGTVKVFLKIYKKLTCIWKFFLLKNMIVG